MLLLMKEYILYSYDNYYNNDKRYLYNALA